MDNSSNQASSSSLKDNAISDYLLIDGKLYTIPEIEQEIVNLEKEVTNAKNEIRTKEKENELIFKKICLRENSLKKQFSKFITQPPKSIKHPEIIKNAVYLNEGLLRLAVGSYYDDIQRYKDYSGSKLANNHKQAAYTIKWIVRFKPIQIREEFDNDKSLNNEILDINLIFALICGFSFLDNRKIIDLISKEKTEVDKYNLSLSRAEREEKEKQSFYDKLLYDLRYRPFMGRQLISIFEALELNVTNLQI